MNTKYKETVVNALKKMSYIAARDLETQEWIIKEANVPCDYYPDSVYSNEIIMKNNNDINKDIVLIVPLPYFDEMKKTLNLNSKVDYEEYLFRQAEKFSIKDKKTVFTVTEQRDENYIKELVESINSRFNTKYYYEEYLNLEKYVCLVRQSEVVISARMHALIIAQLNSCRIVSIPWKRKMINYSHNQAVQNVNLLSNQSRKGIQKLSDFLKSKSS